MNVLFDGEVNDELLTVGAAFRGYRVLRRIGVGGTGEVYLARHEALGIDHAVKVVARRQVEGDAEFNARFFREIRIAARLRHPALIAVHDAGLDEVTGLYFVSMDYLPGGTVADELARDRRFSIAKALGIACAVAKGLSALDEAGVVHRDVKPSNMLIAADGSVKLSDFGIARVSADARTITVTGVALGTPAYMPFEQIVDTHAVDGRADIYALGISLYEMLTGVLPDGDLSANQLLKKRVDGERIPDIRTVNSAIPDELADLIARMTEPDVNRRVRSPREVVDALVRLIAAQRPQRRPFGPARRVRPSLSGPAGLLLGSLLTLGLIGVTSVVLFEDELIHRIRKPPAEQPALKTGIQSLAARPVAERTVIREVIREVTNVVTRTVIVTNFVMRGPEVAVAPEPSKHKSSASPRPSVLTNVVEGITVCGPSSRGREIRKVSRMIAVAADVVREAHGLPANKLVQTRVRTVVLEEGESKSAFDPETKTLRVGVAYGEFPDDAEKMARLCARFMATYSEGLDDSYNALVNGYVRMRVLAELDPGCGTRDLERASAKSPEVRILRLADGEGVLAAYFRIRREAYRTRKLSLAMTKHDFAAVLSLACGGSIFPHLRRYGLKVDEFATDVKLHKLPPAAFFRE